MSNKILFIFEGSKVEDQIVSNMKSQVLNNNAIVECVYGGEIYQIYKAFERDEDLDTFNLVKERENNHVQLASYTRNDFAEIYLFFDYDGHSTLANDDKLKELLDFFSEETDKGKLYVSYPMVEALKHITDDPDKFIDLTVDCKQNIKYKNLVHQKCRNNLSQYSNYTLETWKELINLHLKKMNYLVRDSYTLPECIFTQLDIFEKQLVKHINPYSTVAVLSAFPVFLHDYFGNESLISRIS